MPDDRSLDALFRAGSMACAAGDRYDSNPHDPNTAQGAAWTRGWVSDYRRLPPMLQAARRAREPVLDALDSPEFAL